MTRGAALSRSPWRYSADSISLTRQPRPDTFLRVQLYRWICHEMKPTNTFLIALVLASLVGAARWVFECLFVVPLVPDPQSPIWVMISSISSILILVVVLPFAWLAVRGLKSKSVPMRLVMGLPLVLVLGWFSTGFIHLARVRSALLDSANPDTDPDRLRALADFSNGPGYEIDNRVAKHPNTPADVLRALHGRPNQVGTEICLAQNPNTPDDLLIELSKRNDEWAEYIAEALKRNPRYETLFGNRE